jgi:hypothetical protein
MKPITITFDPIAVWNFIEKIKNGTATEADIPEEFTGIYADVNTEMAKWSKELKSK